MMGATAGAQAIAQGVGLLLLAALPLMGSPGPATLSLAATGSAFGVSRSLRYLAGIIAGTVTVLLAVAAGVVALLLTVPGAPPLVALLGIAYILYLAWRIATAPVLGDAQGRPAPAFSGGYLLAIANPKAFAAIGAVYAGIVVAPASAAVDAAIKVAVLSTVIVVVNSVWLVLGASLAGLLRHPRVGRALNIGFALLLVLSAALALLGGHESQGA